MIQSLLGYTIKPHGHEDAEKELAEVMNLCSKYGPLYLAENEKSEFKNEHDRLQHEIRLYNAAKSAVKPNNVDMVLRDCRTLKRKVKETIKDRNIAAVRAGVRASTSTGGDYRNAPQEVKMISPSTPPTGDPSQTTSHPVEPPNIATNTSLPTPLAGAPSTDSEGHLEPQSGPSCNPIPPLPESHPLPVQATLRQAVSLIRAGVSHQVNSMVMEGATVNFPTANINSPSSTGAKIISYKRPAAQGVPQPARPPRAASKRIQQQPGNRGFLSGAYVSNGSIICSNSRVMGATLNVNSVNSSGAVIYRRAPTKA